MTTIRVRARLATTHPVAAYGGVQFGREFMEGLAEAVRTGQLPMHFNHDITRPVFPTNVTAGVECLDDGHYAAWAEFDVDADTWGRFEAERMAAEAPGGMSFSGTELIEGQATDSQQEILVAADAAHFGDETVLRAASYISKVAPSVGGRLYQFSVVPVAKVIFEIAVNLAATVTPSLLANALYDAAKLFVRPGRSTVFNFVFRERGGRRTLMIHLEADSAAFDDAFRRLPNVIQAANEGLYAFNRASKDFQRLTAPKKPEV